MKKILWSKSIWFFDVDDTLVNTANLTELASSGIYRVFADNFDEGVAEKVQREFIRLFGQALAGYRVTNESAWDKLDGGKKAFDELHRKIDALQASTIAKFGKARKWSREVFIKIACDNLSLEVAPEVVFEAADAYWMTLARECELLSGVSDLLRQIYAHKRPVFLVTGSDARLKLGASGEFIYDPAISEALKRERIEILREKGVSFSSVFIGDPIDKPHLEFYEKVVRGAKQDLGGDLNLSNAIMVGDSYKGDLEVPKNHLNFGLVALYAPNVTMSERLDSQEAVVNKLSDIAQWLSEE